MGKTKKRQRAAHNRGKSLPQVARQPHALPERWAAAGLALVLLFHLMANLWWLAHDNHAITCDEQYHMQHTQMWFDALTAEPGASLLEQFERLGAIETRYPPLLYVLGCAVCLVTGYSTDALVLTCTLLFALTIIGVYKLARTLYGPGQSLFVAFAASFLPLVHGFSRSYATDCVSMTLVVWGMYALIRSERFQQRRWVVLFGVLNGLSFLGRPTAFLFYLAPCAIVIMLGLIEGKREGRLRGVAVNMLITGALTLGIGAPWYLLQLDAFLEFWGAYSREQAIFALPKHPERWAAVGAGALLAAAAASYGASKAPAKARAWCAALALPVFVVAAVLAGLFVHERWTRYPIYAINNGVFLPVFALAMGGLALLWRQRFRTLPYVLIACWLLGAYALMTGILKGTAPRYFLPAIPAFALLAAAFLFAAPWRALRWASCAALAVILIAQYVNLALAPFGNWRRIEVPVLAVNDHVAYYYDTGLVVWKDEIVSGAYILCPPYREENHIDRLLNAMARDDDGRRLGFAAYQWVRIVGGGFRRGNARFALNPFLSAPPAPRMVAPTRPLIRIGGVHKTPQDAAPLLAETDYVAFRLVRPALDEAPDWRRFFEQRGFNTIDRFDATRHDMSRYGSGLTLMARRAPAQCSAVRAWDFTALPASAWDWRFLEGAAATPAGALGQAQANGPWMRLDALDLAAEDFRTVRIALTLTQDVAGERRPLPLEQAYFYWAGPEHVAARPEWPFNNARACPFRARAGLDANVYEANVALETAWEGPIAQAFIGLDAPPESERPGPGPVDVCVRRVELLGGKAS